MILALGCVIYGLGKCCFAIVIEYHVYIIEFIFCLVVCFLLRFMEKKSFCGSPFPFYFVSNPINFHCKHIDVIWINLKNCIFNNFFTLFCFCS